MVSKSFIWFWSALCFFDSVFCFYLSLDFLSVIFGLRSFYSFDQNSYLIGIIKTSISLISILMLFSPFYYSFFLLDKKLSQFLTVIRLTLQQIILNGVLPEFWVIRSLRTYRHEYYKKLFKRIYLLHNWILIC